MSEVIHVTPMELRVLQFMVAEGRACNGSRTVDELIHDNMTWCSVNDIAKGLSIKLQAAGALLGSLEGKGLVTNSGESSRGGRNPDWYVNDAGIKLGWE